MPEGMNVEVAHKLSEQESSGAHRARWHELVEVVEVAILGIVAVATAWSGLQVAKWDGRQSLLYGKANSDRFQGQPWADDDEDPAMTTTRIDRSPLWVC